MRAGSNSISSRGSSNGGGWRERDRVLSYARQSPIYPKCLPATTATDPSPLPPSSQEWVDKGIFMKSQLSVPPSTPMQSDVGIRIFHLYLPLYFWLRGLVLRSRCRNRPFEPPSPLQQQQQQQQQQRQQRQQGLQPQHQQQRCPLVVGINAPQGAGKTTLVNFCRALFKLDGLRCVVLSIDDFYLTNKEQRAVAAKHKGNPLLQYRGNAGTHDVALGRETILKCISAREGENITVPFYDKSLCGGWGDRAPRERWPVVEGPVDVILLEGWMLGFRPWPSDGEEGGRSEEGLKDVNNYLGSYQEWHELVDAWVIVQVEDLEVIYKWRLEAERKMREKKGKEGSMTDEEVGDFVSRFLPAYRAYLQHSLYAADALPSEKPVLRVVIDCDRKPKG